VKIYKFFPAVDNKCKVRSCKIRKTLNVEPVIFRIERS